MLVVVVVWVVLDLLLVAWLVRSAQPCALRPAVEDDPAPPRRPCDGGRRGHVRPRRQLHGGR